MTEPKTCPTCAGTKKVGGEPCPTCDGSGVVWPPSAPQESATDGGDVRDINGL